MRALRLRWLLAVSAIFVLAEAPPAAPAAPDLPAAVQAALEAAGPTLAVAGRPVDAEPVQAFYQQQAYRPVWIAGGVPDARAQGLLQALGDAGRDGLDPADYDVGAALREAHGVPQLAAAEVLLSATLIRYATDLRRGRAVPAKADRDLRVTPRPVDAMQILQGAATAADVRAYVASLSPADPAYRGLRQALDRYRALAAAGGWPSLAEGPNLERGATDPRVATLRLRLQLAGDLAAGAQGHPAGRFDEEVRQAVIRFQVRHGLAADGVVGARSRDAMNVPVDARIRQILLNLERVRWLPANLGDPHVLVNMAAFELEVVEGGAVVLDMRVVVGRPARSTPMFSDEISYLEFNPYWHVPRTILVQDKLPILRSNPASLTAQGIRVIALGGVRIDPTTVDWSTVSASNFPYTLRQDPGERNALGRVKFMFPNPYDIYLHDTPARGLFRRPMRAFSSGCIRVEKPLELAEFLLRSNDGWGRERIDRTIAAGRNRTVVLGKSVPVHLVYLTAWVDRQGRVQFREDLYNRDARLVAALDAPRE